MFDTGPVFEDVLSRRLGSMHAFALFMACGHEEYAEEIMTRAVLRALEEHLLGEQPDRSLERAILADVVTDTPPAALPTGPSATPVQPADRHRLRLVSPACLRRAAERIPARARAAIWLVMVERRSYNETADLLGIDLDAIASLLEWRDVLMRAALDDSAGDVARRFAR
ncbi:MAG TPA: hypothetical protein VMM79_06000 [Longimicrobiales bacterium]|nr:hypothetical protein [Longimicrobiales bacterium]